jgi:hypothetical protein
VSPKNRTAITEVHGYVIEKTPAGRGYMHVVSPKQLREFIEIIPDWQMLSRHLECITLGGGSDNAGLYYPHERRRTGRIWLYAWEKNLWSEVCKDWLTDHRHILDAIGATYFIKLDSAICRLTVAQARAFSLLHVFMHEVGHHRDFLRRRGYSLPNCEWVAEEFANNLFQTLLPRYVERFGDPSSKQMEGSLVE